MITMAEFKWTGYWIMVTPTGDVWTCNRFDFEDDYKNTVEQAIKHFGEGTKVYSEEEYEKLSKG